MLVYKAGTILLDLTNKKIALVYRNEHEDTSFPKGHLENGETFEECAVRETEEETLRDNHLLINEPIYIFNYLTPAGEDVIYKIYVAKDDGPTKKKISPEDVENMKWIDFDDVESSISYDNLREVWNKIKVGIKNILDNNGIITASTLTDLGICPIHKIGANMLKIYNIKEKQEFLKEVAELTQKEWGKKTNSKEEFEEKINNKISKIINNFNNPLYCKLVLLNDDILIGFISIFPTDGEERKDLSPWYATMYVKEEYRGKGYSKILNDAILEEAKKRGFKKLYLKTDLINYYEKFGATFLDTLNTGEKLYYFSI